ncbi:MAG: YfiR family protein [Acidobacteriia bacterium]|nr:YfiR family protein [Terriglobia bacterium]
MLQKAIRSRSLPAALYGVNLYALGLVAFLTLPGAPFMRAQASPTVEYRLKAAFLYNFPKFVEWPSDAFKSDKAPILICVFRDDPFGNALDEILQGKTINSREVLARRINELPDLRSCQLVFVSEREDKYLSEILNSLRGTSALVVGESDGFAERGGAIQFFLEDNKLRFAVNVDAVRKARLSISSKLLALARIVPN